MFHTTDSNGDCARSIKHSQEDIGLLIAHLMEWQEVLAHEEEDQAALAATALDRTVTALERAASEMMLALSHLNGEDALDEDVDLDAFAQTRPHPYADPTEQEIDED